MSALLLPYTRHCFVCGAENPHGLQLRFRFEDGEIRSDFLPKPEHTGYKGVVHGGIISSALDETMFWAAAFAPRQFYVSVELTVRYLKLVEAAQPYRLVARLTGEKRKLRLTAAELRDRTGTVCASATATFFPMRPAAVRLALEDFCVDPQTLSPMDFFRAPR
jgi:uncharacterized protein (TIGR00369 family)